MIVIHVFTERSLGFTHDLLRNDYTLRQLHLMALRSSKLAKGNDLALYVKIVIVFALL